MTISDKDIAIEVKRVSKLYKMYDHPMALMRELITRKKRHAEYWALQDIDFSVQRGEIVGIVGVNGAGKSTLLKIITGTLEPTFGEIIVNGKISAILELGTGFHPQYSGRENVKMGCLCLGMTAKEINAKMDWIIDFSELEDVIDQPFHTYSSGMKARLTFATAVSVDPDIFIVDEALAAGDAFFSQKCMTRIKEICSSGCTALFVSHAGSSVIQLCQRAIWLEKGKIKQIGSSLDVVRAYEYSGLVHLNRDKNAIVTDIEEPEILEKSEMLEPYNAKQMVQGYHNDEIILTSQVQESGNLSLNEMEIVELDIQEQTSLASLSEKAKVQKVYRAGPYKITRVELLDETANETRIFRFMESMKIRVHYELEADKNEEKIYSVGLACAVNRVTDFLNVMSFSTNRHHNDIDIHQYSEASFRKPLLKKGIIEAIISPIQLTQGEYYLSLGLLPNCHSAVDFYEYRHYFYKFAILRNGFPETCIFYPTIEWSHNPS